MAHADVPRKRKEGQENDEEDTLPPPPDGGWGWVVVFASFMIHIVTDGMTYSFGMFYVEFLEYFNEGSGYTAWIVSILVGVTLCSGPISSSFVNRFGCRAVTIAGAILSAASVMVSALAPNVLTLMFTIGVGAGLGFGLIYLPAIVCVTVYFERYRSLATGIAVCGSGFGTFVFAPLTDILIKHYGWRGALVIIGALILNCIIFGIMFRPLPEPKIKATIDKSNISSNGTKHNKSNTYLSSNDYTERNQEVTRLSASDNEDNRIQRSRSIDHVSRSLTNGQADRDHFTIQNNGKLNASTTLDDDSTRFARSQPALGYYEPHRTRSGSGLMMRPDVLYQGSMLSISKQEIEAASICSKRKPANGCLSKMGCGDAAASALDKMIDFSLLGDGIFIVFTISNILTNVGFYIPYVYIAAQAEAIGLPTTQASYCLSTIGIANSIGRIVLGYLCDKPWINRLYVYNISLMICGIATALSVFCLDFYSLTVYSAVFGFTIGAYVGLTSVILVDLLGIAKLTNAFGLLLLFQGIASLIGPPVAGWMYDAVGSYKPGFYSAGFAICLSGLMLFVIPSMQQSRAKKLKKQSRYRKDVETSLL